ncbi:hypothetical protein MJO28_011530 [Puccinia striiformis f. sp. tritici]|uniref:Uncharacterized protein n=3 Tax=Puccinia striiformis f. sp. tritici TaxID=168172 RepID=A0ACC0E2W4_9BASI|nr:hypothetical protein Pst134EB_021963 [Puccinia striiformis f. sp. tritici]KAI9599674.1 hypothetical protein KEM48_008888 [Puccinia striiformis f. sp. tritici PST-130]KAI7943997.1 hypothetical protein MJO28_011525 [Puccinia striiformis f. sp. tritici]KAI7943999.1 hypothetical protein MJO28_011527 [Puccinia striiformis f. sp. tritici]KAI7944002.1 hypothetical protein MJO28_011530 [Puccinia striiformis f. sp. tritici]
MSDVEDTPVDVAEEEVEVTKEADAPKGGQMSVDDALKKVLKTALVHDGLAQGLRESAKALDKRQAHLCIGIDQAGAEPSPDANKEPQASRKRRRKSDAQKAHRKRLSQLARPQRRKNSRAREFENVISNEDRFVAALISAKKLLKYDLFYEISKEVALQNKGRSQEGHEY